jgi:hypothetical protein
MPALLLYILVPAGLSDHMTFFDRQEDRGENSSAGSHEDDKESSDNVKGWSTWSAGPTFI